MASWKTIRKQTLERDNFTCQKCGVVGGRLEAHHKHQRWQGGEDKLDNLITLCMSCHDVLHAEEYRLYSEEMDRIGNAQREALKQCEKDFYTQTGCYAQLDNRFDDFCKNWPGWADVPQYP